MVYRGWNGFNGVCTTLQEHNLWVIGALGVCNQQFRYRSWAVAWLAEQAEEARLQARMRAEEEACNGGSKAKYRVVRSAERTAGSREGNGGWHFDAECGQEGTWRLPTAERIHVGTG